MVRQECTDLSSVYQERRMNYDKVGVGLDLERQTLEKDCNFFQVRGSVGDDDIALHLQECLNCEYGQVVVILVACVQRVGALESTHGTMILARLFLTRFLCAMLLPQEECLREESRYHYLQHLSGITKIKLDRAEQERQWQKGKGRMMRDFASLKEFYAVRSHLPSSVACGVSQFIALTVPWVMPTHRTS